MAGGAGLTTSVGDKLGRFESAGVLSSVLA